jgi:hypothetical protein
VRALHTADLHFDPPRRAVADLLPCVLDEARRQRCELLLLAGDIFDHGGVPAAEVAAFFALLGAAAGWLAVVLLPGNHDVGVFGAPGAPVQPPNVAVLRAEGGEVVRLSLPGGAALAAWGKPVHAHTPEFRPLAGCPPPPADGALYVVLGHGLVIKSADGGWNAGRSAAPPPAAPVHHYS